MVKRTKWGEHEKNHLKELLQKYKKKNYTWKQISEKLKNHDIHKNPRQCREQWNLYLNPKIKKNNNKWTIKEENELFNYKIKYGNKWTLMKNHFINKSSISIKNRFFLIVRKSLRNMLKILNYNNVSKPVDKLRTKLLDVFLNETLILDYRKKESYEENNTKKIKTIDFIKIFNFNLSSLNLLKIPKKVIFEIKCCINLLLKTIKDENNKKKFYKLDYSKDSNYIFNNFSDYFLEKIQKINLMKIDLNSNNSKTVNFDLYKKLLYTNFKKIDKKIIDTLFILVKNKVKKKKFSKKIESTLSFDEKTKTDKIVDETRSTNSFEEASCFSLKNSYFNVFSENENNDRNYENTIDKYL